MITKIAFALLYLICVIIEPSTGNKTPIWSIEKVDDKISFTISDKKTLLEIFKILTVVPEISSGTTDGSTYECNSNQMIVQLQKQKSTASVNGVDSSPLKEVAQGKTAYQSSTWDPSSKRFDAGKAVDGDTNTFQHTDLEQSPFWLVDLGKYFKVKRVEIINRSAKEYAHRLHDLNIWVGGSPSQNDPQLCAHFKGPAESGERLVFNCDREINGTYVKLVIKGKELLHVAEVKVFAYDK